MASKVSNRKLRVESAKYSSEDGWARLAPGAPVVGGEYPYLSTYLSTYLPRTYVLHAALPAALLARPNRTADQTDTRPWPLSDTVGQTRNTHRMCPVSPLHIKTARRPGHSATCAGKTQMTTGQAKPKKGTRWVEEEDAVPTNPTSAHSPS